MRRHIHIDPNHPLTAKASRRMHAVHPLQLLGWIFGGIGGLFLLLGGAFLLAGRELLPQVFTAEAWLGDTPDSLAIPMVGVVFAAIGVLFAALGAGFLIAMHRRRRMREELERFGERVTGTVADIVTDRTYTVNGRHPLRITIAARHPGTGEEKHLRSGPVWETALSTGDAVDVLFDPMDEKKYLICLPE